MEKIIGTVTHTIFDYSAKSMREYANEQEITHVLKEIEKAASSGKHEMRVESCIMTERLSNALTILGYKLVPTNTQQIIISWRK